MARRKKLSTRAEMVPIKQVDLALKVSGDAFEAAMDLHQHGLWVNLVLGSVGSVCGWCTEAAKDSVVSRPCVVSWELNERKRDG